MLATSGSNSYKGVLVKDKEKYPRRMINLTYNQVKSVRPNECANSSGGVSFYILQLGCQPIL